MQDRVDVDPRRPPPALTRDRSLAGSKRESTRSQRAISARAAAIAACALARVSGVRCGDAAARAHGAERLIGERVHHEVFVVAWTAEAAIGAHAGGWRAGGCRRARAWCSRPARSSACR